MSVQIRLASLSDAEPISAVFLVSRQVAMPWLPALYSDAETRWWIRTTLLSTTTVWVARCSGQVVGFIGLCGNMIEPLYVHPIFWDRGIGTQLLETVQAEPVDRFGLSVFQRNTRARRFYERRGFKLFVLGTGTANEEGEPDAYYEWYRPAAVVAVR